MTRGHSWTGAGTGLARGSRDHLFHVDGCQNPSRGIGANAPERLSLGARPRLIQRGRDGELAAPYLAAASRQRRSSILRIRPVPPMSAAPARPIGSSMTWVATCSMPSRMPTRLHGAGAQRGLYCERQTTNKDQIVRGHLLCFDALRKSTPLQQFFRSC
jgi:hypothetical protein